jgi:L-ascorbate metabolism protein UlaG (beta-lactamase superfamily)
MTQVSITRVGGPTALLEIDGFRLLTDPTFDAPGEYRLPHVTLQKTTGPALSAEAIGPIDAVLLSHDQHADNLDHSGRACLAKAGRVFTTVAGANRLGSASEGLAPWEVRDLLKPDGSRLRITATPARQAGRHRATGWRRDRFCPHMPGSQYPCDLHHRRYGLV